MFLRKDDESAPVSLQRDALTPAEFEAALKSKVEETSEE